jgi:hypothetical protein
VVEKRSRREVAAVVVVVVGHLAVAVRRVRPADPSGKTGKLWEEVKEPYVMAPERGRKLEGLVPGWMAQST